MLWGTGGTCCGEHPLDMLWATCCGQHQNYMLWGTRMLPTTHVSCSPQHIYCSPQHVTHKVHSYDLVKAIRKQRLKWIGEILRTHPNRLVHQALLTQYQSGMEGTLLDDVPPHSSFEDLVSQVKKNPKPDNS